MSTNNKERRTI